MNTPQDRVIKKMIDNIVESNRPVFERPTQSSSEHTQVTSAPSSGSSHAHAAPSSPTMQTEDSNIITRKLEYGFNSLRQENAELRKQVTELNGAMKMLRNDMDTVRQAVLRAVSSSSSGGHPQGSPARDPPTEPMTSSAGGALGAPQYRKSEADEAYDRSQASGASNAEAPAANQARGFAKKEDAAAQVDISKVFYYGKK